MKVLVMIKGDGADEDKVAPTDEMFAEMNVYNEQLVNAGIMLAGEGLKSSSNGAKVVWASGEVSVTSSSRSGCAPSGATLNRPAGVICRAME